MNEKIRFLTKKTLFRDTIIPYPVVCVCVTTVIVVMCLSVLLVVSSFWSWSQAVIFNFLVVNYKEKENTKKCVNNVKQFNEREAPKIVIRGSATEIKKRYKIPPRNENTRNENDTTTTNDNINNNHNIDNSKNYQTTTTTTTTKKGLSQKFLFNPILLFSTVSYDFIVAPDMTYLSFSLHSSAEMQFKSSLSTFSYLFFLLIHIFTYKKKLYVILLKFIICIILYRKIFLCLFYNYNMKVTYIMILIQIYIYLIIYLIL